MANLGLLCRTEFGVDPSDLNEPDSTSDLIHVVMPYQALLIESQAEEESPHDEEGAGGEDWENWVRLDDHDAPPMELDRTDFCMIVIPALTSHSSGESQWTSVYEGVSTNGFNKKPLANSLDTRGSTAQSGRDQSASIRPVTRTDGVVEGARSPFKRIFSAIDQGSCAR
ncbi:hypothetical protein LTR86_011245 [Recurvomyces mirabilis]|nr:hypothetical protein LTR86_011245 [Recurvomyces mirabilis]